MDKKFYETPDMEVLEIKVKNTVLVGSPGEEGGEMGGSTVNTDDPGWDNQF